jgi:diguanylate cyclase (GGDEF)-like protein
MAIGGMIVAPRPPVPRRALVISGAALAVPIFAQLMADDGARQYELLLWMLALVPAFLLAYYRGWTGAATALALGMATLSSAQTLAIARGHAVENWPFLLQLVTVYVVACLAIGWGSELLHRAREKAERLAFTDELTGLPNRRQADLFLEKELEAARRGRPVAVVIFDIDFFKEYNDAHGHQAGDAALRRFGAALAATTRRMNLSARTGGDEFLSILSGVDAAGAVIFAERVQGGLLGRTQGGPELTVSAGVCEYRADIATPEAWLAAADAALYEAKAEGRNRIHVSRAGTPARVVSLG